MLLLAHFEGYTWLEKFRNPFSEEEVAPAICTVSDVKWKYF
jgi:hypothetical protein